MTLKEASREIGINYNTAKTYLSELKKAGLSIGRRIGNRLDLSEEDVRILREISETSVREYLERNKVLDIQPLKTDRENLQIKILNRFKEEIEKRDRDINNLTEELRVLRERLEKIESTITNRESLWTRIKKFFRG